jgi:acyl carrier protein
MQDDVVYTKLTELFRDLFSDDEIVLTPTTTASDIDGWDSFNHISIIVAVETLFGIHLDTREIERMHNVGAMVDTIKAKSAG